MYFPRPAINENDLAIIERGDTASHSIEAGQYVSWKGKLGKAVSAILQGATLDDSLFSYETDGMLNDLNNKFVRLLAPTSFVNGTNVQLSDSIENYDEVYVEIYLNLGTGYRSTSSLIPVSAIKNNGYGEGNQHVISGIGTVNITSSQIAYCLYAQVSFKDATTFHMEYSSKSGWGGSMYVQVYAK